MTGAPARGGAGRSRDRGDRRRGRALRRRGARPIDSVLPEGLRARSRQPRFSERRRRCARHAGQRALGSAAEEPDDGASAIALDQVRPETPVDALPLSARARNALDRAGVATVAELVLLPRNQLSVVRGVGTFVAREIVTLADALRVRFEIENRPVLVPGFVRPKLGTSRSPSRTRHRRRARSTDLVAAGIKTTVDAALAHAARIEKLLGRPRAEALRERLVALAAAEPTPGSLGDWARELIGRANRNDRMNKRLRTCSTAGLDPLCPTEQRPDTGISGGAVTVFEAAGSVRYRRPAQIYSSLPVPAETSAGPDSATATSLLTGGPSPRALDSVRTRPRRRSSTSRRFPPRRARMAHRADDDVRTAAALLRVALELRPNPRQQHG